MVRSRAAERTVAADDFFTGPFRTSLAPDEIVVAVDVPAAHGRTGLGLRRDHPPPR